MDNCNIEIDVPNKILKGAGITNSTFLPAWIYNINIIINNNSEVLELASMNIVLPNGIRFLNNLKISGPDIHILDNIKTIIPNKTIGNNNVIIFANNIKLSPKSKNIISFDFALCDKFTINSNENSGDKIPHKHKLNFSSHLLCNSNVYSCNASSEGVEYLVNITHEKDSLAYDNITKFSIECKTGQYDMVKSVYFRNILDDSFIFLDGTSNIEPNQIYPLDDNTVLKWEFGSLMPCETRKVGYKVKIDNSKSTIKSYKTLVNYINSNCVNNSTYTQCPSDDLVELTIK